MQIQTKKLAGLTGNQLKLLALFAMTCDHVGLQLLPQFIHRAAGRAPFRLHDRRGLPLHL